MFVGYCNGAKIKKDCANVKLREEITLPVTKNGFIYTGDAPEYEASLIVIDVDGKLDLSIPLLQDLMTSTMAVHTGGDGLHFFFWYPKTLPCPSNERNVAEQVHPEFLHYGVKGVDIRGHDGKIFAAGSQFEGHGHPYMLLNDLEPSVIETEDEWLKIKNMFLKATTIAKKDLIDLVPSLLTKSALIEIAQRIIKNNLKHHGAHDFWLRFALYANFLGIDATDITNIFFIVAEHFAEFITKEIEADRIRVIEDACSGRYTAAIGEGIEEFFDRVDFLKIKSILAHASKKIKEALDDDEKKDWVKEYGDWALQQHIGFEETIGKLMYFEEIYKMNNYEVQKQLRSKMEIDGRKSNQKLLQNVVRYIQDKAHHAFNEFDSSNDLLVLQNGIWNKELATLQPFDPNYLASIQYQFKYNAEITEISQAPKFAAFIQSIDPDVDEQQRLCYMLKMLLENEFITRKGFVIWHGAKDSGKGVCLKIIQTLIGMEFCMGLSIHHAGNQFAPGDILHKRLAFDSDAAPDPWTGKAISFLKKLTGMDLLRFEKKGKDAVTGKNTSSLVICCNRVPLLSGNEEMGSITGRAYFKYFPTSHEIVEGFEDFIREEKDAIGSYLLNLPPMTISKVPKGITLSAEEYWKELSNPAYKWCKDHMHYSDDTDEVVSQNDVLQAISQHLIVQKIAPAYEWIKNEITYRICQIGALKFFKQINNVRCVFIKNVSVDGCTAVSIAGLEADADYEHAKRKSFHAAKDELPEM